MDVTNQGFITLKQLRHAYANLSLSSQHGRRGSSSGGSNSSSNEQQQLENHQLPPDALSSGKVTQQQFKQVLGSLLQTNNITGLNQVRNTIQIFSAVRPAGTVNVVGRNTE